MRQEEFEKLKDIFDAEERVLPAPKVTHESILSDVKHTNNDIRSYFLIKEASSKHQPIVMKSIDEFYASILKTIPKRYKQFVYNYQNIISQQKKLAILCTRELKRSLSRTSKTNPVLKCKRINKEINTSIKRSNREEIVRMKKEEKEEELKRKKEEEEREELRQKRKFNYLMSQTEAFTNFFLNKKRKVADEDTSAMKAAQDHLAHLKEFDKEAKHVSNKAHSIETDLAPEPENSKAISMESNKEYSNEKVEYEYQSVVQSKLLNVTLKEHQLKGLNWLVNLYNQGINGILADDMGLGKTVQSISLLAHLAENEDVWGSFLIITPSSTLHNWASELQRFLPKFTVLNYWGGVQERKELRKRIKKTNCIITSYQVAVSDEAFIGKVRWQYMILDEAQAIKSINSQRWKILLGFKARNRLLLTGTPIQNNMQELWSLLHFIMPTLFDSLSEFSEWFSKDIENKSKIEEEQLNKLHTMLKPFMLRRNKNDIKDEIGSKEIINVVCEMNNRQRVLYEEVVESKLDYENIIMQLKKVCNHPDLFEKLEPSGPFNFSRLGENGYVGYKSFYSRYLPTIVKSVRDDIKQETFELLESRGKLSALKNDSFNNKDESINRIYNKDESINKIYTGNSDKEFGNKIKDDCISKFNNELLNRNRTVINLFKEENKLTYGSESKSSALTRRKNFLGSFETIKKGMFASTSSSFNSGYLSQFKYKLVKERIRVDRDHPIFYEMERRRNEICNSMKRFKFMHNKVLNKHMSTNLDDEMAIISQDVFCPPLNTFISDSGKLTMIDSLLAKLKEEGHRVLIYFQMTRMMDLFEEYLVKREYNYLRLDGSSKISHRKELVESWQGNEDIFIFILSTRAGGVGINLTAADTVIFYDSDWNPTVDQQAMDRVHRLGQTKDVKVYRLITKNSVEERVMARANKKEEVQKIVIKGNIFEGSFLDQ